METIRLKDSARRARVMRGHPWVYANEVEGEGRAELAGCGVRLEDGRGRFMGVGVYNPRSQIVWRRYATQEVAWDAAYVEGAMTRAYQRRDPEDYQRLVWSEADGLPGVIVDRFGEVMVVQMVTAGAEAVTAAVVAWLQGQFAPREIVLRNDAPSREMEGLARTSGTLSGKPLDPFWGEIHGIAYKLDLMGSQKTGFYLDQREEAFKVATFAEGWRVLDAFCNQGTFALNAARAGAREVLGIDISGEAVARARENAAHNQLVAEFAEANLFDWFTANRGERFDLIVLDPPSFARNRRSVEGALKGYGELHLRALRMLTPGGILATYCCSHHVEREAFMGSLEKAARDARRTVQLLYESGQPLDHPVILGFPESQYLKGAIVRVE